MVKLMVTLRLRTDGPFYVTTVEEGNIDQHDQGSGDESRRVD